MSVTVNFLNGSSDALEPGERERLIDYLWRRPNRRAIAFRLLRSGALLEAITVRGIWLVSPTKAPSVIPAIL